MLCGPLVPGGETSVTTPWIDTPTKNEIVTMNIERVRRNTSHPRASGIKRRDRAEDVAPKKASIDRRTVSRWPSSKEIKAQGRTAKNIHMVFVMFAVLSNPSAGISTTNDASTTCRSREANQLRERWYTLHANVATVIAAMKAR